MAAIAKRPTRESSSRPQTNRSVRLHQPAPQRHFIRPQPSRPHPKPALARFLTRPMGLEKAFTLFSFLIATTLSVLCAMDLTIVWPWKQASLLFDWGFLTCGLVLLGLTVDVFKEQTRTQRKSRWSVSREASDETLMTEYQRQEQIQAA